MEPMALSTASGSDSERRGWTLSHAAGLCAVLVVIGGLCVLVVPPPPALPALPVVERPTSASSQCAALSPAGEAACDVHISCRWSAHAEGCVPLPEHAPSRRLPSERGAPLMGWSSWNHFRRQWDEQVLLSSADAMAASGMLDAGYDTVFMDGGWWSGVDSGEATRNGSGHILEDRARLPRGVGWLVRALHRRGFNYGHYTNAGTHACNGDKHFAFGYERIDAELFAEWGVDFLKIDTCGTHYVLRHANVAGYRAILERWRAAFDEAGPSGRRVFLNNCRNGCLGNNGVGVVNGDDGPICSAFPTPTVPVELWCYDGASAPHVGGALRALSLSAALRWIGRGLSVV